MSNHQTSWRILRLRELCSLLGKCRSSVYSAMDPRSPHFDPEFPRPIRLGATERSAVGWRHDEIHAWVESRERVSAASSKY